MSITAGTMAGWVVIPIRTMFTPIQGEDAARFLDTTGFHPLLVALAAILLSVAFLAFAHSKGIVRNAVSCFCSLYKPSMERTEAHFNPKWCAMSFVPAFMAVGTILVAQAVPYAPSGLVNIRLNIADVREALRYE